MFGVQTVAKITPKIVSVASQQCRTATFIASKPRTRIPFAEKCIHGMIFLGVPMVIPLYIATHFKEWNKSE